jgi:hypothetical protein
MDDHDYDHGNDVDVVLCAMCYDYCDVDEQ